MASHNFEFFEKSHATSVSEIYEAGNAQGGRFLIEVLGRNAVGRWLEVYRQDHAVLVTLRHPGILETLDIGVLPDGTPVVVSERPAGMTLGRWLAQGRLAPARASLELLADIADALGAAHEVGVSHGGLGADDVLLLSDPVHPLGIPKLRGFGHRWLRAAAAYDGALTMVPGGRVVPASRRDVATDVAALAVIADRLLTPFHRGPRLAALLRSAQLLDDEARFATPMHLVHELERFLGEGEAEAGDEAPMLPRRRSGPQWVAGIALLTVAIGAAALGVRVTRAPALATAAPPVAPPPVVVAPAPLPPRPAPVAASVRPAPAGAAIARPAPAVAMISRPAPAAAIARPSAPPATTRASKPRTPKVSQVWSARENKLIYVDELGAPVASPPPEN